MRFTLPILALSIFTVLLVRGRRWQPLRGGWAHGVRALAAAPLLASGTLHLLAPGAFLALLPPWVPARLLLIRVTGLPELGGALCLFVPALRRPASVWLAGFMVLIFPANIYVAGQSVAGLRMPEVPARTAMQAAYILLLLVSGHGWPRLRSRPCP